MSTINTIIRLALKEGCEARFITNRLPKMRFRFHGSSAAEKVQDLRPNEAREPDKRTNGLESVAQVSLQKSGPYDLMKSEAALTKVVLPIRLGKILNINLIESLEGKLQQHRYEVWMVRYSPNTAGRVDYWNTPTKTLRMEMPRWM